MRSEITGRKPDIISRFAAAVRDTRPVPADLLYYFAIPVQQIGSGIAGIGFVLNNQSLFLVAAVLWVAWFFILFITGTPRANKLLGSRIKGIRKAAAIVFVVLLAGGLFEIGMFIVSRTLPADSSPGPVRQVLSAFGSGFTYNDSTALTAQAVDNLIAGRNPYQNSNVVTALAKYNPASDRLTPLRTGVFADVFPYPTQQQIK